jgi:hypothetical protein
LSSVFVASCEGPKSSSDAWRAALNEELEALAQGRVPAAEIEGAALRYSVIVADRYDDLFGRAAATESSILTDHGAQALPESFRDYLGTNAASAAAGIRLVACEVDATASRGELAAG